MTNHFYSYLLFHISSLFRFHTHTHACTIHQFIRLNFQLQPSFTPSTPHIFSVLFSKRTFSILIHCLLCLFISTLSPGKREAWTLLSLMPVAPHPSPSLFLTLFPCYVFWRTSTVFFPFSSLNFSVSRIGHNFFFFLYTHKKHRVFPSFVFLTVV